MITKTEKLYMKPITHICPGNYHGVGVVDGCACCVGVIAMVLTCFAMDMYCSTMDSKCSTLGLKCSKLVL